MGNVVNMIISNDLLFYGIIVFLIVGVVVLFMYLHHKKVINLLEEEIEFTKVDEEKNDDISTPNIIDVASQKIDEKINSLDGKLAIEKILNEDVEVKQPEKHIETVDKVTSVDKKIDNPVSMIEKEENVSEKKSELEIMLEKMQQDLEEQKDKDAVAIFEQEQEEKSIISYKELLEKKNDIVNMVDAFNDERFENEPTMIENDDVEETLSNSFFDITEKINDVISVDSVKEEHDSENKKFTTTDFISPVFGRRTAKFDYPKVPNFKDMMIKKEKTNEYDLEATLNLEPLTDQIKKDDAFLNALKEFRKNLE